MVGELKGHTDTIYTLKFSRDGEILASGMWTEQLQMWFRISHIKFLQFDSDNLSSFFRLHGQHSSSVGCYQSIRWFGNWWFYGSYRTYPPTGQLPRASSGHLHVQIHTCHTPSLHPQEPAVSGRSLQSMTLCRTKSGDFKWKTSGPQNLQRARGWWLHWGIKSSPLNMTVKIQLANFSGPSQMSPLLIKVPLLTVDCYCF